MDKQISSGADDRPQYVQIRDLMRDRIAKGQYPVGSFLPTESELCAQFTSSRHTVREALRLLTEAGLIQRRQGSGSRVMAATPHQNYVHAMRSLDQLFQYASDTRFLVSEMTTGKPEPTVFPEVGDDVGECLIVRALRLERDEDIPICDSIVLVNAAFAGIADELEHGTGAIYRRIEERFGVEVAQVVQDISVCPMPAGSAKPLGKTLQDVAVCVRRRYLGPDGAVMLASVNYHPADRFAYTMDLRREGPKGAWS